MCSLMGTVFMLRCVTMFVTSLSVPGQHLQCSGKVTSHSISVFPLTQLGAVSNFFFLLHIQMYGDMWAKLQRAVAIWSGFGMTLTGVHTCGDYMFSGHTVVLTMLNFFVTECKSFLHGNIFFHSFFLFLWSETDIWEELNQMTSKPFSHRATLGI